MTTKGPWGSTDILLAFEADDVGSNPTGPAELPSLWKFRKTNEG